MVRAIHEMDEGAREQLLLHRFLSGIPEHFSRTIRASTDVRNVHDALQRAELLALAQHTDQSAVMSDIQVKETTMDTRMNQLEEKLDRVLSSLSNEADETMVIMNKDSRRSSLIRCFRCQRIGNLARDCRTTENTCLQCGKRGHLRRECSLNYQGPTGRVTGRPLKNFQTELITDYQIVSTSIFPSSLTVDQSAMIAMCVGDLMVNSLLDSG